MSNRASRLLNIVNKLERIEDEEYEVMRTELIQELEYSNADKNVVDMIITILECSR